MAGIASCTHVRPRGVNIESSNKEIIQSAMQTLDDEVLIADSSWLNQWLQYHCKLSWSTIPTESERCVYTLFLSLSLVLLQLTPPLRSSPTSSCGKSYHWGLLDFVRKTQRSMWRPTYFGSAVDFLSVIHFHLILAIHPLCLIARISYQKRQAADCLRDFFQSLIENGFY